MSEADAGGQSAASLTATVLEEEAAREERQAEQEILFADDLLPGVGSEQMTLKEGLEKGGAFTFVLLLILNSLDELESGAMSLLAPDIRDTFGVSDGTIVFITAASAAFIVLGAFPMGWLADRYRRAPIIGISTALFTFFVFLTGLAVNAFMMFWTRFGVGIAKANTLPVHSSLIADTYPIAIRGRMAATTALTGRTVNAVAPALIGLIVVIAGGGGEPIFEEIIDPVTEQVTLMEVGTTPDEAWRWAFLILGLPVAFFAFLAFRLPEPPRGQWEKDDVLGSVIEEEDPALISVEAAFARLLRIRTVKSVIVAFSAMGFLLFTLGVQTNIYLEDEFGLGVGGRSVVATITGLSAIPFLPFIGRRFDGLYRRDPAKSLRLISILLLPIAALIPVQFMMPNEYLFVAVAIPVQVLFASSFSMVGPTVQAIVPYRLRGLGTALVTLQIFLIGAIGGALVASVLIDAWGARAAIITIAIPALSLGSLMLLRGASSIKYDLSLIVAELQEELEEHDRQRDDPGNIPAIQVADVDFSYGPVQVLFDLNFSVSKGETLALLGTNGAGKSTILRVITGLGTPQRGVIRLHGRTITYSTPEQRAAMGIQMLPGGKGTFPNLTIGDNLRIGAYRYRHDHADVQRRIDRVLELFPSLADRLNDRAGDLSGGQQQMLALARVMLHEPEVLIIDELSLGLAPTVVQDLLENIDTLKEAGQTMIIVEQSLNVALAIADRAVFLEKGQVRFEGSAQELVERDDLARAVFLGTEGG